jgi:hypothetical protein
LRRFEFELFDTEKSRDVDPARDCFIGLAQPGSQGVRVRILSKRP